MNEEQMQKEFEELVVGMKDAHGKVYCLDFEDGIYVFKNTHDLWTGFKLAYQAKKPIKLPMWCMTSDGPSKYLLQYEVIEAIEQAGYKVAP